jgi:predicted dehydrogenase
MREKFPEAVYDTDPRAMLAKAKPDRVCICTPNSTHHPMAIAAIGAGAHVMCEKPMALTVAEALEMEAARAKAGVLGGKPLLGAINFSYRCVPGFRYARELMAAGELGTITRVNVVYLQSFLGAPDTKHSWRNDVSVAGFGALGDLGVHMLDAVGFTTGLTARRAVGLAQVAIKAKADATGVERPVTTDTNASWLIEYHGGAIGTFETTQVAPGYGNHFRIEVSGTLGTVRYYSEQPETLHLVAGKTLSKYATWKSEEFPKVAVPSGFVGQQPKSNIESFVGAIRGLNTEYPSFSDGVAAQQTLEALGESMRRAAWVDVG